MTSVAPDAPTRSQTLDRARDRGLKILAALPYHYPRALVRAHGFHPTEVWAPASARPDTGAAHFQAYTCSIVTRGTAFLIDGGFDRVDAVLVPHGCDALQGMGSVLRDFVTDRPAVHTLYAPRTRRPLDQDYLVAEYQRLAAELVKAGGREPTQQDWIEAFAVEDAADAAMRDLYKRRGELNLTDREFYDAVRAREYLLPEDFAELVAGLPAGTAQRPGLPIVLSGIMAEPPELLDIVNDAGAHVAADDLSTGTRRILPATDDADPWQRLARSYLDGPADPTRADPLPDRVRRLRGLVDHHSARGVLVIAPPFCEPEQFYLPALRKGLDVPLLYIEHEGAGEVDGQLTGRIEAFVETLEVAR
ncbi:MAG TPA: 2-hydroxyacyl-CoA dehydratase family protein [Actinomycetota bacterium]|nr:2-hydroxyacyl-CoA dehydratase family protein [Actinomycetota bacterium]